jgi:hypothetical protein
MTAIAETLSAKAFKKPRKNKKQGERAEDPGLGFVIDSTPSKVPARLEFAEDDSKPETPTADPHVDENTSIKDTVSEAGEDAVVLVQEKFSDAPGTDAAGSPSAETSDEELVGSNSEDEEEEGDKEKEAVYDTQLDVFRPNEHEEVVLHEGIVGDEGDTVSALVHENTCVTNTIGFADCSRAIFQSSRRDPDMHTLRRSRPWATRLPAYPVRSVRRSRHSRTLGLSIVDSLLALRTTRPRKQGKSIMTLACSRFCALTIVIVPLSRSVLRPAQEVTGITVHAAAADITLACAISQFTHLHS